MPRRINFLLRRFRGFSFIFLSSVLLVLPFHFGGLWFLAFIAFIPYFFVLTKQSTGEAFQSSFLFGFLFFAFLGYWLTLVNVLGFILLVAYLALYFAFFGMVSVYFLKSSQKSIRPLFFIPAFWVVAEYLRGWIISGLPWALLGYSQWRNTVFIQIADITGVWGVSYVVLLINLLIFKLIEPLFAGKPSGQAKAESGGEQNRRLAATFGVLVGVIFLVSVYGMLQLSLRDAFYKSPKEKAQIRVSVIQGNIPQEQKWDVKIKNIIFEKYKRLTFMSAIEKSDLIVWPETSFPGYLEDEPIMSAQLRSVIRQSRTEVLVGAPTMGDMDLGLRFYNSAILFNSAGEEKKRYHKMHLVPFGEYVPYEPVLGIIRNFVHIGRFSPGEEKTIFETTTRYQKTNIKVKYGVLICFEDIFPGPVRGFCKKGADFMINMTNDAWFGKTAAPYQHAAASIFRAVENRINVVRATNTGYSCFISPEGRILNQVEDNGEPIFVTGHKGQDIILRKTASFYTRFGDVFMLLVLFLCFLAYKEKTKHTPYSQV